MYSFTTIASKRKKSISKFKYNLYMKKTLKFSSNWEKIQENLNFFVLRNKLIFFKKAVETIQSYLGKTNV